MLVAMLGVATAQASAYPNKMAALGDSITLATNANAACAISGTCPEYSWATGSNTAVDSYYQRLQALNPSIVAKNFAENGTQMSALKSQVTNAVSYGAELVTIQMGSNDACTSSVTLMTSVAKYKAEFKEAMNVLTAPGSSVTQVNVSSLPNVYRLWEILHTNAEARKIWELGICQSMLANPLSLSSTDEKRRLEVRSREEEYDAALQSVCLEYAQCKYDDGAEFMSMFSTGDVSTVDYFHPSVEGQKHIAQGAWEAFNAEHQFYGDSPFVLETTSHTTQIFQLGTGSWVECNKLTLYVSAPAKATNLGLPVKSYGECIFNHFISEIATSSSGSCEWLLKSFGVVSFLAGIFKKGPVDFNCTLSFTTSSCHVTIPLQTQLKEYQWTNLNTVYGSYESELTFDVTHMSYEISGFGCGAPGTNGEYRGSIPLPGAIMK